MYFHLNPNASASANANASANAKCYMLNANDVEHLLQVTLADIT